MMEIGIKLKIKDVEIELSVREAKELKGLLEKIIGKDFFPYAPYTQPLRYWDWSFKRDKGRTDYDIIFNT